MDWSNVWGQFKTQLSSKLDTLLPKAGGILTGKVYMTEQKDGNQLITADEVDNRIEYYTFNVTISEKNKWYTANQTIARHTNRIYLCIDEGDSAGNRAAVIPSSGGTVGFNYYDIKIDSEGTVLFKSGYTVPKTAKTKVISIPCKTM